MERNWCQNSLFYSIFFPSQEQVHYLLNLVALKLKIQIFELHLQRLIYWVEPRNLHVK